MKLFDTFLANRGWIRRAKMDRRLQSMQRSFAAAQVNRLTADWLDTQSTIDRDIRTGGELVRNRARDLVKNDEFAKRFVSLHRTNVVGPLGFKLLMDVKERIKGEITNDEVANTAIEEKFKDWSKPKHCSVSGKHSFRGVCDLLIQMEPRDGEAGVRLIFNKESKYGFQVQVIEAEAVDERYQDRLPNGNIVKMGVELNRWRAPVAYYLRKTNPEFEQWGIQSYSREHDRLPVSQFLHGFDQQYPNQTRGISRLVQSMITLKMLSGYDEAALVNARVSAAKMGFFSDKTEGTSEYPGQDADKDKNKIMSVEPGSLEDIGMKQFTPWAPEYPSQQHEMFVRSVLRRFASGTNLSYNMLANDLVGVNYSSIRAGLLDEREMWKLVQQWFVETWLNDIFEVWLEMAIMSGQLNLPISKLDKFNQPTWIGRRWAWVDPLKDVEAKILEVQAGFTTATQVVAEQGDDIVEVYQELAGEKKLAAKLQLKLKIDEIATFISKAKDKNTDKDDDDRHAFEILKEVHNILKQTKSNGELVG